MFTVKNLIRLILFIAFALPALGYVPKAWQHLTVLLPALSPLLSIGGAIAARVLRITILLALPLLILPLFKGRLFCWRLCPMGFAAEMASRVNKRNAGLIRKVPFIGKALAPVILGSAAFGWPLLIWTDPLCIFNGFFTAWREPLTWLSAATASGFIFILLASLIIPNVWCHRLCPLGGLEEWLTQLGKALLKCAAKQPEATTQSALSIETRRRAFLGFTIGGVVGLTWKRHKSADARASAVIRPPGAAAAINALCARCGNCMKACPYGLITPDLGASGIDGLLTPAIKFRSSDPDQERFCFQDCVACNHVCPTSALRPQTVEQKQQTAIGLAVVDKKKCIAWAKQEYCMVCSEYCPYHAVHEEEIDGVMCPIVEDDKCRGCGACESQCPALPLGIVIKGRNPQPYLTDRSPQLDAEEA